MAVGLPFYYQDFHGGFNTKDAADLLTDNEARDLMNVQGVTAGAVVKRAGLTTFASPAVTFTSLVGIESTTSPFLIGAGGTAIYSVSTGGTVTALKTGLTSGLRWEACEAPANGGQGPVWMMNGTDTPQAWDGTSPGTTNWTATSGSVPNGKFCLVHQNQVFVAGVAANPSRLYWSGLQAGVGALPRDWDPAANNGAGAMDFDPGDGQAISSIARVGPYVLVAKPRKLWVLIDPATATVRRISDNVGVIAHRSVASGANGTYFLAEDRGVYMTNGSTVTPISDKIQPTIDAVGTEKVNASGVFFNGHYYLSVASQGTPPNDVTLDWDEVLQSWWKHSFGSSQFAIWHPTTVAQLYSAKSTSAIVDRCFVPGVTTDNGTQFKWYWKGPWQSPTFYRRRRFPTPFFRKRLRQIRFEGIGTIDLSLAKDYSQSEQLIQSNLFTLSSSTFGGTGVFGGSNNFGGSASLQKARVYGQGVANAFSLVFSATSSTQDELTSYTLIVTDRKDLVVA